MSDVGSIVDGLDLVVGLADGHLHPDDLDAARSAASDARERVGHLGSTLVLALLGGTGAGKSSLLNAIAGSPVASTSAVRPHTTVPLAWVPEGAEPSLSSLLDELEIDERVPHDRLEAMAILDMTDVDSLEVTHRRTVEQVLPEVDVGIWVLDPVKYADPVLHDDFIAPAAAAADRLVFVLNQIDTIAPDERGAVRDHLIDLLRLDGIARPVVFETAADPPIGPRLGIDHLVSHLRERIDHKRVHLGRVVEAARAAASRVAGATGVVTGGSLDFETKWEAVRQSAVSRLAIDPADLGANEEALRSIEHLVGNLSGIAGGAFGVRLRQAFNPDRVEELVREAIAASDIGGTRDEIASRLDAELQSRIGAPVRKLLWERASLSAVVAGLAVDATAAEARLGIGLEDD